MTGTHGKIEVFILLLLSSFAVGVVFSETSAVTVKNGMFHACSVYHSSLFKYSGNYVDHVLYRHFAHAMCLSLVTNAVVPQILTDRQAGRQTDCVSTGSLITDFPGFLLSIQSACRHGDIFCRISSADG
jgi:hypothetical protein